jgi:hypothetical protein
MQTPGYFLYEYRTIVFQISSSLSFMTSNTSLDFVASTEWQRHKTKHK